MSDLDNLLKQLKQQEEIVKTADIKKHQETIQMFSELINKYKPHNMLRNIIWLLIRGGD